MGLFKHGDSSKNHEDASHAQQSLTQDQPEGRILHVYYQGFSGSSIRVDDSDKTSVLYNVDIKSRKPQLTIQSVSSNTTIATVDFHLMKTRLDAIIHGNSVSLSAHGMWQSDYSFDSPAFGGIKMTWKPRSKMDELKMVLLNDKAMPVARFEPTNWAMQKSGKFELLEAATSSQEAMDEVVVTALAVIHYRHLQRLAAAAAC